MGIQVKRKGKEMKGKERVRNRILVNKIRIMYKKDNLWVEEIKNSNLVLRNWK